MKYTNLFALFICAMLLFSFGCINEKPKNTENLSSLNSSTSELNSTVEELPEVEESSLGCPFNSSFSEPKNLRLSFSTSLSGEVSCAKNKVFILKIDGVEVSRQKVETDSPTPIEFTFYPKKDGPTELSVSSLSSRTPLYTKTLNVSPLGESRTSGKETDDFSFKSWLAYQFEVKNPINLDSVRAFLRRRDSAAQEFTNVRVQIYPDSNGVPSKTPIASSSRSINDLGLDDKWLTFQFSQKPALNSGKYWVVLNIEDHPEIRVVSDTIGIRTIYGNKDQKGNDYTKFMRLDISPEGVATQTSWQNLPFDRTYSITIHAQN